MMSFYQEAIHILKALIRVLRSPERLTGWMKRRRWPPYKKTSYHRRIPHKMVQYLSNRRRMNPCNKIIKSLMV